MPIVHLDPSPLDASTARPEGLSVTPMDNGSDTPEPSFGETVLSAFRQGNIIASAAGRKDGDISGARDPGFNPWDAIKGTKYEPHWNSFVDIHNESDANLRKRQLDMEEDDRRNLEGAPWYKRIPAELLAGTLDLPTLLPGGAFVRGAKGGFAIGRSALMTGAAAGIATELQETGLHPTQEMRTAGESAMSVGTSVFLGSLLGAGGTALMSRAELRAANDALEAGAAHDAARMNHGAAPASVGAAAHEPAPLEGNTIAGAAAGAVAAATRQLNPLLRLMQSPSPMVRDVAGKLFENSLYLKKNFEGVASEPAVETLMKEWNGALVKGLTATDQAHKAYRKGGGALSRSDFEDEIGKAMRRGDEHVIPEVAATAKVWRSQVFDPLKDAAIKAGQLPEDVSVDTAPSYFSRMPNRNKIIAQEGRFKGIITDHYKDAIADEFEKSAGGLKSRIAKLDQETQDLSLSPEGRTEQFGKVESEIDVHEQAGEAYLGLSEKADRLTELKGDIRRAKQAGDTMVARQTAAAGKQAIEEIEKAGGRDLEAFIAERSRLRTRRRNIEAGAAGLAERSQAVAESLADVEEASQRGLARLVKKGQTLERELDRLDPDMLAERISAMKTSFETLSRQSDAAAERAEKALAKMREGAGQVRETGAVLAAEVGQNIDEKIATRIEQEAARQRARAKRMTEIAERLEIAEGFDRDGAVAELRNGIEKAVAESSSRALGRGERAARLQERLAALDPQRIARRVTAIDQIKKDLQRKFYDRWEIKNLGEGVDLFGTTRPDFTEAARAIADRIYDTWTGRTEAGVRPEFVTVGTRGPMKDRTFNIPDEKIEGFLEHNISLVGRRYVRVMGADVEMANKFGSVDMKDQIDAIRANYKQLRAGVTDEATLKKLTGQETADLRDITDQRDLQRGTRAESPNERNFAKIVRMVGHVNYIRSMGEAAFPGSLTDAIRPAMVHGLLPYMQTIGQLATNMKGIKLSTAEAQLAGNVAEQILAHRTAFLTDITDPYSSKGAFESLLEKMSNVASKWNGIRMWTDMMKSVSSVMTQNRILEGVGNFGGIKKSERAYLAYLGIDQSMAERIVGQFGEHGETVKGVRVANTTEWTDAVAVRAYRAALNKDVDSIIVQASKADVPTSLHTMPTVRLLLQFQSFNLASHQRVMMRGLQESPTRFIGGVIAMTSMGMLITYLKALSANRTETLDRIASNPGWLVGEGLDRSGVFPIPIEIANRLEKMTGFNPIKAPLKMFDKGSAESQKNQNRDKFGGMLGPTVGLGEDIATVAGIPMSLYQGQNVSKAQKNAGVRIFPYSSFFGVRQIANYVVNPPAR